MLMKILRVIREVLKIAIVFLIPRATIFFLDFCVGPNPEIDFFPSSVSTPP